MPLAQEALRTQIISRLDGAGFKPSPPAPVTAELDGDRIRLHTPFALKDVVKGLPGARWDAMTKTWHVPATATSAQEVLVRLSQHGLVMDQAVADLAARQSGATAIRDSKTLPPIPKTKTAAWEHQVQAFWFMAHIFGDKIDG